MSGASTRVVPLSGNPKAAREMDFERGWWGDDYDAFSAEVKEPLRSETVVAGVVFGVVAANRGVGDHGIGLALIADGRFSLLSRHLAPKTLTGLLRGGGVRGSTPRTSHKSPCSCYRFTFTAHVRTSLQACALVNYPTALEDGITLFVQHLSTDKAAEVVEDADKLLGLL